MKVLDASTLLAPLRDEAGAAMVKSVVDGALMCTVNLAEIVGHYVKLGAGRAEIESMLRPLPIRQATVDEDLAWLAGMLRPVTIQRGLSLGDRFCLALAKREGAVALTADRGGLDIAGTVGVEVELIR
jgi:PIN domain nuclease of toxin-antitoxin system